MTVSNGYGGVVVKPFRMLRHPGGLFYNEDIAVLNAHDDVNWVPINLLLEYDLAPADVAIARELQKRDLN